MFLGIDLGSSSIKVMAVSKHERYKYKGVYPENTSPYSAADEGIPVDFVYPKEGAALTMNCAVIPKNSKNADLAKIFINYHLSQACQEGYAEVLKYGPTNSTVTLPDDLAAKVVYGPDDVAKLVALDNQWVSENEAAWTEKWNTMILD